MIVSGINVRPLALIQEHNHRIRCRRLIPIELRSSLICSPKGVAALSIPAYIGEKFISIVPVTGCPLGIEERVR